MSTRLSPRLLWRLMAIWRRQRWHLAPRRDRAGLAKELLETVSPSVLFSAGYLRYRGVYRRRIRYARLRQGRLGPS
jgi:hypothetical protein